MAAKFSKKMKSNFKILSEEIFYKIWKIRYKLKVTSTNFGPKQTSFTIFKTFFVKIKQFRKMTILARSEAVGSNPVWGLDYFESKSCSKPSLLPQYRPNMTRPEDLLQKVDIIYIEWKFYLFM